MNPSSFPSKKTVTTGALVTATSLLLGVGVSACSPTAQTTSVEASPTATASEYKDGTYTVMGNYTSPGGEEQIEVTVTLAGDQITAAEVTPQATLPMSQKFQGLFKDNFKQFVMGKNIDEVHLDAVSGSSLTPKGFNDALEKVKMEARV